MLKPPNTHKNEAAIIKRGGRKHEEEAHGGAWKVAFADFCLALLCLFLVLWLMATREQQALKAIMLGANGNKADQGAGVMPEPLGGPRGSLIERIPLQRNGSGTDQADPATPPPKVSYETPADLHALAQELARMSVDDGLSSNLQTVVTPYGLRVMMHDTDSHGMFVRGSAMPTDRFRRLLRKMGPLFARMSNQMLVIGHTDSLQYASTDYAAFSNWTLSSNRAMAARAELLYGKMDPDTVLQVVGMADRAPLDPNNAAAGVNRRIELLILTSAQGKNVGAMFGMPEHKQALTREIDTVLPDLKELQKLREQLGRGNGSAAAAPHSQAD